MRAVKKAHLKLLQPFLVGEQPTTRGEDEHLEWDMYCPLHEDRERSSGINLDAGVWYCQAGCGGGRVTELINRKDEWVDPPAVGASRQAKGRTQAHKTETINDESVATWVRALRNNREAMDGLVLARGLEEETIRDYELGWDAARSCYAIPIRDAEGALANVRRYTLNPAPGRRKMWSVSGMGKPTLYPYQVFENNPQSIVICEGEMDALLSIQNGYPAVTRTGSATTWKAEWGEHFAGKNVYLCHDMDAAGQDGNKKIAKALERVAKEVRIVALPYKVKPKHGKDLTDFWLEDHSREDFAALLKDANKDVHVGAVKDIAPGDAAVIDSFDAKNVGTPLRLTVTIKGKREPGYSIVREAALTCTRDAGEKCAVCPLYPAQGEDLLIIHPNDPVVLELVESTRLQVGDILRQAYGTPKCSKLTIEPLEYQGVEVLFARPSVDHANGKSEDYKNIKITSVGRHDTMANNTVEVVGALFPEPRHQMNEFQAWDVERLETSIDKFEMTPGLARSLHKFQPKQGERPLKKLGRISRELASHVTKIYGRPELHAALDLVWHSALGFTFDGNSVGRGWLDLLVVGDTRTGKSEAATRLANHYSAGEVVSCESASYAGIVGGAQQLGSRGEWAITWGSIPLNDRRLVVLDEVSGLSPDAIAQMSSVRSSGTAEITKIQQERTYARTRLVWLGNPRNARMADFTYGVQAIPPLIGNPEDVARFDFAMCVRGNEVSADEINKSHAEGRLAYGTEACSQLVRWVWSRTPDQVKWAGGAEQAVYEAAKALGERYVEDPPLVQVANVRIKVARMAVALAARLFSTDAKHECIVVKKEHVEDAVKFLDMLYSMPSFGYAERSKEAIADAAEAKGQYDEVKGFLLTQHGLAKFLRNASTFRRQDLEEILNIERTEANGVINQLWASRMVRKEKGDVRVLPALHDLLREVK